MLALRCSSNSGARSSSALRVQPSMVALSTAKSSGIASVCKPTSTFTAWKPMGNQLFRGAAKQKLTPAQKSLREKQQHAKLVEEVMNKLDEPEYHYVNQGQREAIKNHTNLVIVLHMVIEDNKEFKKRLDTWCAWNPGTPGVFAPKKTDAEKAAEAEKKKEEEVAPAEETSAKPAAAPATPKPAPAAKKDEKEEDFNEDEPILPDEDVKKPSTGKFEIKSFLKQAGFPAKDIDSLAGKLKTAGFGVDLLPEVNDAWLKKNTGLPASERQLILKQTFAYLAENPVDD